MPQAMLDRFPWDDVGSLLPQPDYSHFVPVTSWSSTPCPEHINCRKLVKVTFPDSPGFVGQVHPAGAAAGICLAQPLPINLLFLQRFPGCSQLCPCRKGQNTPKIGVFLPFSALCWFIELRGLREGTKEEGTEVSLAIRTFWSYSFSGKLWRKEQSSDLGQLMR